MQPLRAPARIAARAANFAGFWGIYIRAKYNRSVLGFSDLKLLLAKATPLRSGDLLAGIAAESAEERVAAQFALADVPLMRFCEEAVVPYEDDEVTRLIVDTHDATAFAPVRSFTVGEL